MIRARRIVEWVLSVAGGALALALGVAAFVLFTGAGARIALHIANGRDLPAHARSISGTLAKRFTLVGVEVHAGPLDASMDTVMVAWRPMALRTRRIALTDVLVAGASVRVRSGGGAVDTTRAREHTSQRPWAIHADRVRVRSSRLDAPGNVHLRDVDFVGAGGPDGYRATVRAAGTVWRVANVRAFAHVAGTSSAATIDSLDVRALDGVVHGSAFVRWTPALSWRANISGDGVRIGELADSSQTTKVTNRDWAGAIDFRAGGTGLIHDDTLRVGINLASLDGTLRGKKVFARGRVNIDGPRIAASGMSVRWGSASATLSGHMAQTADVRLDATIPSLAELWPDARGSAHVRGRIDGTPESVRVRVDAGSKHVRVDDWSVPDLDATVDATLAATEYRPYAVVLRRADARVARGTLSASGRASWKDGVEWNARVDTRDMETSFFAPKHWNLYGPVSMSATSSGMRRGRTLRADLALASLSGRVRDRAVLGTGRVSVKNGEAEFSGLDVTWGSTHVRADGHAGKTLDLDADVMAPDLAALVPSWHGAVSVRGRAHGPIKRPAINAVVSADSLHIRNYAARHIDGHVDLDPAFTTPADIDLTVLGAVYDTNAGTSASTIDTVHVTAAGPRDNHHVSLSAVRGTSRVDITLRGAYADTSWAGTIADLRLRFANTGAWRAAKPASLYLTRTRARVDSLVLTSNGGRIAANASWRKNEDVRGNATVSGVPLAVLQKYLVGTTITGTVDGAVSLAMHPGGRVDAEADLTAGPGEVALGESRVAYSGRVTGRASKDGVAARVTADISSDGSKVADLDGSIAIEDYVIGRDSLGTQPITGQLDLECKDIGPVMAVFVPSLASSSSGSITAHIKPRGTVQRFFLVGDAALKNARVDTRDGMHLRKADAQIEWDGEGRITMHGEATSGGGRVEITASSARAREGGFNSTFAVKGERFQIMRRPDADIFVSPDLQMRIEKRVADITGEVAVPYARIEVAQVPASAATTSPDVVIVEDTLATEPKLQARTHVRVALGDSVTFNGFGLRSRLSGSLQIDDERGRPTRGSGEIQIVDGKYRAFGSELKIDPGRLVFGGGPIDNPGIDMRAYRGLTTQNVMAQSSGEIVGVKLRGSLRKPELTLFSNPPMSESEIMSYLLFGRSNSKSSGGEQNALAGAALLLSMQKGTQMAGEIGKKFSLDEAYLETGEEHGEAAFVAGKYLSPKLYVSYAAGLFEHTNTFRARYSLTGHWTLQAESGKDDSTDLLYWFERGK